MLVLFVCVIWGLWGFFKESALVKNVKAQITSIGKWEWSRH